MSAPSGAAATNGSELPYGGDVQAAAKAQDREAIRTIMAWRTAKERGEAPPTAAPAPAPAEALAAAAAAAPTRRSLSDLVAAQDERAPPPPAPAPAGPPPSILGNKDGWAASEPAPPATIEKLQATLAAEVAKKEMASEDAPAAEGGMAAHDKAAGRAPPTLVEPDAAVLDSAAVPSDGGVCPGENVGEVVEAHEQLREPAMTVMARHLVLGYDSAITRSSYTFAAPSRRARAAD